MTTRFSFLDFFIVGSTANAAAANQQHTNNANCKYFFSVSSDLLLSQSTISNGENAFCVLCNFQFMRNHDNGHTGFMQLVEQFHNLFAGSGIQSPVGSSASSNFWMIDHCPCNGNPLFLSAGKLRGQERNTVCQTNFFQCFSCPFPSNFWFYARIEQGQSSVFQSRLPRKQVKVLKDKSDFFSLRICESIFSEQRLTSVPSKKYEPLVGVSSKPIRFMRVDFPEPEAPHNRNKFPVGNMKRNIMQHRNGIFALLVGFSMCSSFILASPA